MCSAQSALVIVSIVAIAIPPSVCLADANAPSEPRISAQEAAHLAELAVRAHDPHPILDPFDGKSPNFYFFEEIDPNPNRSAHVRSIAVNKTTGDVWSIDGICEHMWPQLTSKQIRKLTLPRSDTPWECDKPDSSP